MGEPAKYTNPLDRLRRRGYLSLLFFEVLNVRDYRNGRQSSSGVEEGTKILVDRMAADVNSEVSLDKVLMVGGAELKVGAPYVENAKVTATVLDHVRGDKILVFKKWRRNDSRKLQGHRQDYTAILVKAIEA